MKARVKEDWKSKNLKKGELVDVERRRFGYDCWYDSFHKNGKWLCDENSINGKRYFEIVTSPTISLKLEGIEEGEKFKIVGEDRLYMVKNNMLQYQSKHGGFYGAPRTLEGVLLGKHTIEKIPQKTETELEIEKLRAQVAEFNAQIDKLESTL